MKDLIKAIFQLDVPKWIKRVFINYFETNKDNINTINTHIFFSLVAIYFPPLKLCFFTFSIIYGNAIFFNTNRKVFLFIFAYVYDKI